MKKVETKTVLLVLALLIAAEVFDLPSWYQAFAPKREGPRYIFVDGGAHKGETARYFFGTVGCSFRSWEYFAFEPNVSLHRFFPEVPRLQLLSDAIADSDGTTAFYFSKQNSLGGSVVAHKRDVGTRSVSVPTLDFAEWLKRSFRTEDFVWVKLDIEGAEYPVLDRLLETGAADHIDMLFIEFHNKRVGISGEKDRELIGRLKERNVKVVDGDAAPPGNWFGPPFCLAWSWCGLGFCGPDPLSWIDQGHPLTPARSY